MYREVSLRPSTPTFVLILFNLALGFLSIVFALDENVAEGKVAFANDAWRWALGAAGAFIAYRAARALVRTINAATVDLSPAHFRRARVNGLVLELIGWGFILAAWNHDLGQRSVAFFSWAKPVYGAGGILLVLTGLLQFMKPASTPTQGPEPTSFPDPTQYPPPQ